MESELEKAENEFEQGNLEISTRLVNKVLNAELNNVNALLLRFKILYKQQKWGEALNDLNQVLELNPDHHIAINYKQMVMNILTFWNKDNYNP